MTGYAVIHPGLEQVVVDELREFGIEGELLPGGVRFPADAARVATLARTMRTPSQLLLELATGRAHSPDALAQLVRKVSWRGLLHPQTALSATVTSKSSALRFREAAARRVESSVRDALKGPFIPDRTARPRQAQTVQVRIVDDEATLSLDAGGELLHRRGWRTEAGKAPLRENVAACLIRMSEWQPALALLDPFCGSGTVPIEAALQALGRPPFGRRPFACDEWMLPSPAARGRTSPPPATGTRARGAAGPTERPAPTPLIVGSDNHTPSLEWARRNAGRARVKPGFVECDVGLIRPHAAKGVVVTNPPWGERLGRNVEGTYGAFGNALRDHFTQWRIWFLAPNARLAAAVDRRAQHIVSIGLGGIPVGIWALEA